MPTPRNHAATGVGERKDLRDRRPGRRGVHSAWHRTFRSSRNTIRPRTNGAPRARMPTARSALGSGVIQRTHLRRRRRIPGPAHDGDIHGPSKPTTRPATRGPIMPSMPVSRHGLAAGVIGNRLILVGGDVQSSGTGVDVSTSEVDALVIPSGDH